VVEQNDEEVTAAMRQRRRQDDELYAKPDAKVMANVKDEKVYRAESRAVLKAKMYGGVKDTLEDIAFGDCETENKG
jgi:hypothetical protein